MRNAALIGMGLVAIAGMLYVLLSVDADSLRQGAEVRAEILRNEADVFVRLIAQAREDLDIGSEILFELQAVDGSYFDFAANDPNGGGVEIIAYRNPSGSFEKIWEGQDYPDCYSVEGREVHFYDSEKQVYKVPASLVPTCYVYETRDRTTPPARLLVWLSHYY